MLRTLLLACFLIGPFITCFSQAGAYDLMFGNGGRVHTNFHDINEANEVVRAVAIQPDGKIIIAGTTARPGAILRFLSNGQPDNTFNQNGTVFIPGYKVKVLTIQPDQKIVVAGDNFNLSRLNPDGTFDNSFGINGSAQADFASSFAEVRSIALQTDGKIILGGHRYNGSHEHFALARFNSDGTPDESFDGDGKVVMNFGPGSNMINSILVQPDGKILAAGVGSDGINPTTFALARFTSSGSADNTFDTDGKLTTTFDAYGGSAVSLALQPDGKIIAAGNSEGGLTGNNFAIARYNSNGTPDNSFSGDGKLTTSIDPTYSTDQLCSISHLADGKILAVGNTVTNLGEAISIARYHSNGTTDNSFDGDGIATAYLDFTINELNGMCLNTNGSIVTAGKTTSSPSDFAIGRFHANGSPDLSFGTAAVLRVNIPSSTDEPSCVIAQADGKIIVGGFSDNGNSQEFAMARYLPGGGLDNSFDADGKQTISFGPGISRMRAIAIQPDGKIVTGGTTVNGNSFDFALARYNTNGSPDITFGVGGKVITTISDRDDYINSIAVQADGKIVVGGSGGPGQDYFILARYSQNGTLDNSFDGDGIVFTTFGTQIQHLRRIVIQPDGKIVSAGVARLGANYDDIALTRHHSNGSPDNSFDGDGKLNTDFGGSFDNVSSMILQPDGKIVIGGDTRDLASTYNNFLIARYNNNGTPDNNFNGTGHVSSVFYGGQSGISSMKLMDNGHLVVAGRDESQNGLVLAKFLSTGSPDLNFANAGKKLLADNLGPFGYDTQLELLSNKVFVTSSVFTAGGPDFFVASVFVDAANAPLPMKLLTFNGQLLNDDAVLNWRTENEINTREFIVERSIDGRTYSAIGNVQAANVAGANAYHYTDKNIMVLTTKTVYYRLLQKDMDGRSSYSRIVPLAIDPRLAVLFYPNPVINEANIAVSSIDGGKVQARIFDSKGRMVKQQQWNLGIGTSTFALNVESLARGVYYFELQGSGATYRKQFVK